MEINQAMTISNIFEQVFEKELNNKLKLGWQISSTNIGSYPEETVEGFGEVWQAILTRPKDYSGARVERLIQLIELAHHGIENSKNDEEVKLWQQKDEEYEAEIALLRAEL